MQDVILPTGEIIHKHRGLEPIFCFYEDGIKGLVKDQVLASAPYQYMFWEDRQPNDQMRALADKVITDYENSIHRRYLENTNKGLHLHHDSFLLDLMAGIEWEVNMMMFSIFMHSVYDAMPVRYGFLKNDMWMGNDLVVKIRFLDNHDLLR